MNYYSLHHQAPNVSSAEAVIYGIAPDRGLYFPENISPISSEIIESINEYSNEKIAFEAIKQFVGEEIPEYKLKEIIQETISFDFPISCSQ